MLTIKRAGINKPERQNRERTRYGPIGFDVSREICVHGEFMLAIYLVGEMFHDSAFTLVSLGQHCTHLNKLLAQITMEYRGCPRSAGALASPPTHIRIGLSFVSR
jgi:hypothetical protein